MLFVGQNLIKICVVSLQLAILTKISRKAHTHTLSHHLAADLTGAVRRPTTRLSLQSLLGGLVAGLARLVSEPW